MLGALQGKTATVTGAARGIGAAIARRSAAEGATLILNDIRARDLDELTDSIEGRHYSVAGNIRRVGEPDAAVVFLAGEASFVTGTHILADGGYLVR